MQVWEDIVNNRVANSIVGRVNLMFLTRVYLFFNSYWTISHTSFWVSPLYLSALQIAVGAKCIRRLLERG